MSFIMEDRLVEGAGDRVFQQVQVGLPVAYPSEGTEDDLTPGKANEQQSHPKKGRRMGRKVLGE